MLGAIIGDTIRTQWYMLERFLVAQERDYECALQEIKDGQKQSHWIWYIFPQIKGLGYSSMSEYYGIGSRKEAEAYLANNILNAHLREITQALLSHSGSRTAWEILGTTDALKVCSCMTLFDYICPNDIFAEVLDTFYEGQRCRKTLHFLKADIGRL